MTVRSGHAHAGFCVVRPAIVRTLRRAREVRDPETISSGAFRYAAGYGRLPPPPCLSGIRRAKSPNSPCRRFRILQPKTSGLELASSYRQYWHGGKWPGRGKVGARGRRQEISGIGTLNISLQPLAWCLLPSKQMPRFFSLGFHVGVVVFARRGDEGNAAGDGNALFFQRLDLVRVVGEEADFVHA